MILKAIYALFMLGLFYYVAGDKMPIGMFVMLSGILCAVFFAPRRDQHMLHKQIEQYQSWRARAKLAVPSERLLRFKARARLLLKRREKAPRNPSQVAYRSNGRREPRIMAQAERVRPQKRSI